MKFSKPSYADIRMKLFQTEEHPDIATTYNIFGLIYLADKSKEKSLEYFNRAIGNISLEVDKILSYLFLICSYQKEII